MATLALRRRQQEQIELLGISFVEIAVELFSSSSTPRRGPAAFTDLCFGDLQRVSAGITGGFTRESPPLCKARSISSDASSASPIAFPPYATMFLLKLTIN